jgi:hypothetical protein
VNLATEFHQQAAACDQIATARREPATRADWRTLADRWRRCADWYESRLSLAKDLRRANVRKRKLACQTDALNR